MNPPPKNDWEKIQQTFKKIWGYDNFRPPQGEIIRSLIEGKDSLIIMPTGGGKSLCFQLPALLQNGLTLVISPLVGLMENQIQELQEKKLPAAALHSQIATLKRRQILQQIQQNQLRLLYLSPETLLSEPVWNLLAEPSVKITAIIIDEAHCIAQWGETFRPAYQRLGTVRKTLLKTKPAGSQITIAAFTATADSNTQKTIKNILQLNQPLTYLLNPYRPNLFLETAIAWTPKQRRHKLLNFIQKHPKQSGLIYVRTRQDSEILTEWFLEKNHQTAEYHAGLSPQQRRTIETQWLQEKIPFVICTSAFGMGVNKPNVRWVLHYQAPGQISEYLQEIGRAGRDNQPATALTLVSEPTGWLDSTDKQLQTYLENQQQKQYQKAQQLLKKLPPAGAIIPLTKEHPHAAITLALLHSNGSLTWLDPFNYKIEKLHPIKYQPPAKTMSQYLYTKQCRWQFLLEKFGFKTDRQCGHCDNCQSKNIK